MLKKSNFFGRITKLFLFVVMGILLVGCSGIVEETEEIEETPVVVEEVDDSEVIEFDLPTVMAPEEEYLGSVTLKNVGDVDWVIEDGYKFGVKGANSSFGVNRVKLPYDVEVGETVVVDWALVAPAEEGVYSEELRMLHKGAGWFGEAVLLEIEVTN